jgi:hypothetical protein
MLERGRQGRERGRRRERIVRGERRLGKTKNGLIITIKSSLDGSLEVQIGRGSGPERGGR